MDKHYKDLSVHGLGDLRLRWPKQDNRLWKWVDQTSHVDVVFPHLKGNRSCIQAGGACGVWPLYLAKHFEKVYTFEPLQENWVALTENTQDSDNVFSFRSALGFERGGIKMEWRKGHEDNYGAQYATQGGSIPVLRIDDLGLKDCDLICLDIEGAELAALMGAKETIARCKPVILFEEAGHAERLGNEPNAARKFLEGVGYSVIAKQRDDVLMVHG